MITYIQRNSFNLPHHYDCACAMYGSTDLGIESKLISFDEIDGVSDYVLKNNLFVGSVEFMTKIFNRFNKSPRVELNSNREEELTKLGQAKKRILNGEKLFIKPKQIKLFNGMVCTKDLISCLNPYSDDIDVIVTKPFDKDINSEWRCYMNNSKVGNPIVDIRNYSGDQFILPNKDFILEVFNKYPEFPKSYTIDIAILSNGENLVVEFNDMWAIGNYGIDNEDYLKLLKKRYFQIVNF